jgi:hypothetical protein
MLEECRKACAEQGVFSDHHHSHWTPDSKIACELWYCSCFAVVYSQPETT